MPNARLKGFMAPVVSSGIEYNSCYEYCQPSNGPQSTKTQIVHEVIKVNKLQLIGRDSNQIKDILILGGSLCLDLGRVNGKALYT
ncbi:MAG: hypothetical protein EZS28_024907 [Streblomastix strix]|uniref:Uncharacterized protein n=1 Tax=Streblomastix strix TaxID=222440 RepID=A0A5J4VAT6_9EUKA|nr:MAG: hypothetical protein EZS28_024907 [Streblomastix strix]